LDYALRLSRKPNGWLQPQLARPARESAIVRIGTIKVLCQFRIV
jgi:hypothetical protein